MKKPIKLISIMLALLIVFAFAGCNQGNDLAAYKAEAKAGLETYAEACDYTPENWEVVLGLVAEGKAGIDAAADKPAVDAAVETAEQAIDDVPQKEVEMNFPSVLENFELEDFTEEFFENNTLILVPFYYGYLLHDYLDFYTVFVDDGKINFLIEVTDSYGVGERAVDFRLFVVIIPNKIFNKYEIGQVTTFTTYDFIEEDGNFVANKNDREWLKEIEEKSINHIVGFIFDQSGWKLRSVRQHDSVVVSSIEMFNELLETAIW